MIKAPMVISINAVRQKSKEVTSLLQDDARLRELRQNRGNTRERLYGNQSPVRRSGEDDELRRAIEMSKEQAQIDERRRLERQEEDDLQRAIELSEKEAMQRRMDQRDQLAAGNAVGYVELIRHKDDIIDFFGSLEPAPQPITSNDAFGGFDPFQAEQQRMMMEQQQYVQQQMFLQQQQQEQARQQQMMQQQMMMQEQLRQQQLLQQQQQQQAFASQFASNPHNPFAAPPAQPKPKPPPQAVDLSSNPK
jgi:epsin